MSMYLTAVLVTVLHGLVSSELSCNFEHNFCDWLQLQTDHLDWGRSNTQTADMTSGPQYDHTTGKGFYVFMSGSHAGFANATADLISPTLTMTSSYASMSFWYHMNGVGIGSLLILLLDPTGSSKIQLWGRHHRQGVDWKYAHIELPEGTYKIGISATARLHYGSDIAIDDVVVEGHFYEKTISPSTSTQEPVHHISALTCSFDDNFCAWHQDVNDQFDWKRTSLSTPDRTSGPLTDHTTGNSFSNFESKANILKMDQNSERRTDPSNRVVGNSTAGLYAYISGHQILQPNSRSRMVSPIIKVDGFYNLSFWYHMNGHGIGSLSVKKITEKRKDEVLVNMTGRQGPAWLKASLKLEPGIYKLAIDGTARLHYGSDIAIDDIAIKRDTSIIG